jgi:thiol-disulfide isomerase/thioredoxin
MAQTENLSEEDARQLAQAKGKTARPLLPEDLSIIAAQDTTPILAVHFWRTDCPACLRMQNALQNIQLKAGESKLKIIAVNLDAAEKLDEVNMAIRTAGITAETFHLAMQDGKWKKEFSAGWNGSVPALFLRTNDGFQQFYQQEFSENELTALLQPMLL